jgi:CRP-like cAMP-binding protein
VNEFFDYAQAGAEPAAPSGVILAGCSDREWAALQRHCTREVVRAGDALVRRGALDRSLFVVLRGTLAAQVPGRSAAGPPIEPGAVIGEVAFFDGLPRSATVVALTDAEVLHLTLDGYEALAASEPALVRRLVMDLGRSLAARLRAAESAGAAR